MKKIAELLPEGLTEATLDAIAVLVDETITEQVTALRKTDEAKIASFLRLKVDQLKEHALKELTLQNETYRNAQVFEEVKSLMSLEINSKDETSSTHDIVVENTELSEELEVLSEEFSKLLIENNKLQENTKALAKKLVLKEQAIVDAESRNKQLLTEATESSPEPFKSSEIAKVITENVDRSTEVASDYDNEFLTPEVVAFCNPN